MKALLYYIKWPFCALILRDIGQYFVGYFLDYTVCSIAALVQHYCSFLAKQITSTNRGFLCLMKKEIGVRENITVGCGIGIE